MKRFFLSLSFIVLSTFCVAQDFKAGLRAGICGSQVSGDRLSGYDKAGIVAGAFVNRKFSDKVTIQMELVYVQKGSRKPLDELDNTFYRMRLNYMEVPVFFIYSVTKTISLEAGPSFGSLLFSEEENESGVIRGTPAFEKFEISANAGVIYHVSENTLVDVRYCNSLTPVRIYQGSYNYNFFDRGQYNSMFEISLMIQF